MLPTLVLLPGMDGTGELFASFVAALGSEFETSIIRYPTNEVLSYVELAARVRSSLPTEKPFVVLAESFSGPVAVSLAAEKPAGLVGLILCASFVRVPRPFLGRLAFLLPTVAKVRLPRRLVHWLMLNAVVSTKVSDSLDRVLKTVPSRILAARLCALSNIDVSQQLNQIAVPCLYLRATKDRLIPLAVLQPFKLRSRSWKIRELSGPHLLLQMAPMEAAKVVGEFVNGLMAGDN